jgi:integrase
MGNGARRRLPHVLPDHRRRRHPAALEWLADPAGSIDHKARGPPRDKIADAGNPIAANRVLSYARAAYGWAVRKDLVPANPFTGIEPPAAERSRDRVLDIEELAAIWRAAQGLTVPNGAFIRTLLLTAQRRDEVARMAWAELSAELSTWTLPRERAKNGVAHIVHLAEPVRDIIAALPRMKDCPFVFATGGARPVAAYSAIKNAIDAAVTKERCAALPNWRLHDFRRAAVTALAGMGFAPHVCDRILNHTGGAIQGVAAVYQRAEFLSERWAALHAWAAHVVRAAEGHPDASNVLDLRRAKTTAPGRFPRQSGRRRRGCSPGDSWPATRDTPHGIAG